MLTQNSEILLDILIATEPHMGRFYLVENLNNEVKNIFDLSTLRGILDTLAKQDAIIWSDKERSAFSLTETGKEYKQLRALENIAKWKERAIGFVIGVLTGVSITFITSLLG